MKIVFVAPFGLQPKGTVRARALPLAKVLAGRGHSVTLLIPPWDNPAQSGQSWDEDGVRVEHISLPPGIPLLFHLLVIRALVARVLVLRPDVVHFFKPKAYAGLAHLVLWWVRQIGGNSARLVLDTDDWEQAWNSVLPYPAWQKKLFAWQETWGLTQADAVTAASRELERLAAQTRSRSSGIFYLPNGLLPDSPAQPPDGASVRAQWQLGDAPLILLYSRFAEFKLQRIVTLVGQVAAQMPQARWLLVGQGLYGEDKRLKAILTQAQLAEPYVYFAGWPVDNLPNYFAAANAAIYPYDDTLMNRTKCSVKLIELLAAGVPVVADAVGQNCEYIESGVSGLLAPPENDTAFAETLVSLLKNPAEQALLGQTAARHIRQNYSWTHLAEIAERAYR